MKRLLLPLFTCLACLGWMAQPGEVLAQVQQTGVTIAFRNETKTPVFVQGTSIIKGVPRRGQSLPVDSGKTTFDNNVPTGLRLINIYDGTQPSRVLLRDYQVNVGPRALLLLIRTTPTLPTRVVLLIQEARDP